MKKLFCVLLSVCILFSALSVSAFAAKTEAEMILAYDFNKDGVVNLTDARTVLRVSAGLEQPLEEFVYDIDGQDGEIPTINDVKTVLSIVLGIDVEIAGDAFNLQLFKTELNNVKTTKPGFKKTATTQCKSMIVTTRNAPVPSLNVTNQPFDKYAKSSADYIESVLFLVPKEDRAATEASIAAMRKEANELYLPKTKETTIAKRRSHYATFPINNLASSCFLTMDDIESITCEEVDGYIVRTVTMGEFTYIGDEFPTGAAKAAERREKIAYARVFNIPDFAETQAGKETSILNKATFKDGKIVSKIDKLSGIPVSVEYSYTYIADVSTIPTVDKNGKPGLQMDSVTTATVSEDFDINPITIN